MAYRSSRRLPLARSWPDTRDRCTPSWAISNLAWLGPARDGGRRGLVDGAGQSWAVDSRLATVFQQRTARCLAVRAWAPVVFVTDGVGRAPSSLAMPPKASVWRQSVRAPGEHPKSGTDIVGLRLGATTVRRISPAAIHAFASRTRWVEPPVGDPTVPLSMRLPETVKCFPAPTGSWR
jgi:hypothetical protein